MLLDLQIEALGPLAFAERRPNDQFRASLPYVPGGTLLGALGSTLAHSGQFDETIVRTLRCHNAYPSHTEDPWVRPLPLTALQPKSEEHAPVIDTLVARVCWERQQPAALIYAPTDEYGRPWVAVGNRFYTRVGDEIHFRSVSQRVLTRVAINRNRRTAEDGRIYSPLVLNEVRTTTDEHGGRNHTPVSFRGTVVLPDAADELLAAVRRIDVLGGRTSTGLGRVALSPQPIDVESGAVVAGRIAALTKRFREQSTRYKQLGGEKWIVGEGTMFTVNMLSDAILLDQGWIPTQQLSVAMLREAAGISADLTLLRAFTTTKSVAGWHTTWQQPKPAHLAVGMGSVFLFQAQTPLSADDCSRLAALQQDGIGERRQEGYGQVRICDEFHTRDNWPVGKENA